MTSAAIPVQLDWLAELHSTSGLHLVTADREGFVYLAEENPADVGTGATDAAGRAYVSELIRLARIGQRVEDAAAATVRRGGEAPPTRQ